MVLRSDKGRRTERYFFLKKNNYNYKGLVEFTDHRGTGGALRRHRARPHGAPDGLQDPRRIAKTRARGPREGRRAARWDPGRGVGGVRREHMGARFELWCEDLGGSHPSAESLIRLFCFPFGGRFAGARPGSGALQRPLVGSFSRQLSHTRISWGSDTILSQIFSISESGWMWIEWIDIKILVILDVESADHVLLIFEA